MSRMAWRLKKTVDTPPILFGDQYKAHIATNHPKLVEAKESIDADYVVRGFKRERKPPLEDGDVACDVVGGYEPWQTPAKRYFTAYGAKAFRDIAEGHGDQHVHEVVFSDDLRRLFLILEESKENYGVKNLTDFTRRIGTVCRKMVVFMAEECGRVKYRKVYVTDPPPCELGPKTKLTARVIFPYCVMDGNDMGRLVNDFKVYLGNDTEPQVKRTARLLVVDQPTYSIGYKKNYRSGKVNTCYTKTIQLVCHGQSSKTDKWADFATAPMIYDKRLSDGDPYMERTVAKTAYTHSYVGVGVAETYEQLPYPIFSFGEPERMNYGRQAEKKKAIYRPPITLVDTKSATTEGPPPAKKKKRAAIVSLLDMLDEDVPPPTKIVPAPVEQSKEEEEEEEEEEEARVGSFVIDFPPSPIPAAPNDENVGVASPGDEKVEEGGLVIDSDKYKISPEKIEALAKEAVSNVVSRTDKKKGRDFMVTEIAKDKMAAVNAETWKCLDEHDRVLEVLSLRVSALATCMKNVAEARERLMRDIGIVQ